MPAENSEKICERDLDTMMHYFKQVEKDKWDRGFALAAYKYHGVALLYVPEKLMDREMSMEAVKNYPWMIECVDDRFKDREIYMMAVKMWVLSN